MSFPYPYRRESHRMAQRRSRLRAAMSSEPKTQFPCDHLIVFRIMEGMLRVGLTGGIACGKTNALAEFERLGVYGIDADQIGHEVIQPDGSAYGEVVEKFGHEILNENGTIDRSRLGKIIFSNESRRLDLNQIVHPHILVEVERVLRSLEDDLSTLRPTLAMVDAALMIETGAYKRYDVILVVYCHQEIQLRRLMTRDGLGESEALLRIGSQMPLLEKIRYADFVIDNSSRLSDTNRQIHHTFLELISRA